jgi:hypothetical protein
MVPVTRVSVTPDGKRPLPTDSAAKVDGRSITIQFGHYYCEKLNKILVFF